MNHNLLKVLVEIKLIYLQLLEVIQMWKILSLAGIMLISFKLFGQIDGTIVDASNQSPLPGATIQYELNKTTITQNDGTFIIPPTSFPVILWVSYVGYEPLRIVIPDSAEDIIIELSASNYLLGEVIITAFDNRQSILETPGSVSLISKKELKQDNDVYIVPALNRVPGIYMHSGSYNTSRMTIRGIGSRSLFSTTKIRAYYEGIPLTSGDGETTIEDIDPNLIDRIEIIKGPSSSLYGAGLGGTLLIKPKLPTNIEKTASYQITGGSFDYLKNALSLDIGNNNHHLSAIVNKIHSAGWRENNEYNRLSAGLAYKSYLNDKTHIDLIVNFIDLKAFIPSSINRETYETNPRAAAPNWKDAEGFEDYYKLLSGIGIQHQFNSTSSINANMFWTRRDLYERRPFNILTENTNALGGRARYSFTKNWPSTQLNFISGIEYFIDYYKWKTYEIIEKEKGDLLSDNKEKRKNINLFFKSDLSFPSNTFITIGININHTDYSYNDIFSIDNEDNSGDYQFGTTFSPRIGITQTIYKKINSYFTISHGFSPPTLPETLTPEGNINPEIKPETGINYEIGTKGQVFKDKLFIDLAYFLMHVKNLIVARRTAEDEFVGVNAGKTIHKGLETTINYNFFNPGNTERNFIGFITYTLADYSFKEFIDGDRNYSGNELTGIPKHLLNAGISFLTKPGIYGNLNYQFVDKMPMRDDNTVYSDDYQLVNLKLGYSRFFLDRFRLDIYGIINNLFNTKYASMIMVNAASFGGNEPRYYYPGLPRNFYMGAELTYNF